MSPTLTERNPSERPVTKPEAVTELRSIDCKTTKDWERRARQVIEYKDPYNYDGGRY